MDISLSLKQIKNWGIKGGLSVLDHGLYSGANFILSVLLARWLLPAHYGVYSIAFAVYQFAYQAHNALILEPMSVLGPARMYDQLADYSRDQVTLHFFVCLFASLATAVVGVIVLLFDRLLGRVLVIMGVTLAFILFPLLMRRIFYIFGKPQSAMIGSIIYVIVMGGVLWILKTSADVSVQLAFPIIGIAGLVSGIYLFRQVPPRQSVPIPIGVILAGNWAYGRWLLYSSILIALASQSQTFVVGTFLGLSDAGAFRALQNFIQPIILLFTAISALLLPSLSYDYGRGNIVSLRRKGRYLFALFLIISAGFEVFLWLYAPTLESMLYDEKFSSYVYLIPIWGLVPIAAAFTYVYYFLLQSIQRPQAILIGSIIWSATSILSALFLGLQWGIAGATISVVLGYLLSGVAFAIFYRHYISKPKSIRST